MGVVLRPVICAAIAALLLACHRSAPPPKVQVSEALGNPEDTSLDGFERAVTIREFDFPADHNAHQNFKNEWWYFTGNLRSADGRAFGYQVTFFRIALAPTTAATLAERSSDWATNYIWMAHAAVTDIDNRDHLHAERFAREAAGLAGNERSPFRVWLDDWQIRSNDTAFPWHIKIRHAEFSLDLGVDPLTGIILQGERGLSQKSAAPGNASYYYSIPRLATRGVLEVKQQQYEVSGLSWLDREWSTSVLGKDQSGWDWFALQLDSGEDLMYYQLRKSDGRVDQHSSGIWHTPAGVEKLSHHDIKLEPIKHWRSVSGKNYPVRWRLRSAKIARDWIVEAVVEDQLMDTSVEYWEGAVRVLDVNTEQQVGVGYLEMTGH